MQWDTVEKQKLEDSQKAKALTFRKVPWKGTFSPLLAPWSGAHRITPHRDFHPIPIQPIHSLIAMEQESPYTWEMENLGISTVECNKTDIFRTNICRQRQRHSISHSSRHNMCYIFKKQRGVSAESEKAAKSQKAIGDTYISDVVFLLLWLIIKGLQTLYLFQVLQLVRSVCCVIFIFEERSLVITISYRDQLVRSVCCVIVIFEEGSTSKLVNSKLYIHSLSPQRNSFVKMCCWKESSIRCFQYRQRFCVQIFKNLLIL